MSTHSKTAYSAGNVPNLVCNPVDVTINDTIRISIISYNGAGGQTIATPADGMTNVYAPANAQTRIESGNRAYTRTYVAIAKTTGTVTPTVAADVDGFFAVLISVLPGSYNVLDAADKYEASALNATTADADVVDNTTKIYSFTTLWDNTSTAVADQSGGTVIDSFLASDGVWIDCANSERTAPGGGLFVAHEQWQFTNSSATNMLAQIVTLVPISPPYTPDYPSSISSPTVATTGIKATGTLNPNGASVSSTDYTKVILGGQATACAAITALTVGNSTSSGVAYTITLSGLVVPGITFTVDFTDGAFTNAGGINVDSGVLSGTNNSTTIDLIVDSGTLVGTTATINFAAVNVPQNMFGGRVTLYVNDSTIGTFTSGSTAAPVTGGDLITINGYLSDNTLIASGTLFTVTSLTRPSLTVLQVALSGPLVMTPPTNAFANATWRDTTQSVNSTAFVSQPTTATGLWTVGGGQFSSGDSWAFTAVPTYVMDMTGLVTGSTPIPSAGTIGHSTTGLLLGMV